MNVVITGASRGLGKAIAEEFAKGGHRLALCSKSKSNLHAAMESLRAQFPGVEISAHVADLGRKEEAQAFGASLLSGGFETDILVNNAGSFIPGSVHNQAEGVIEEMMAVNFYSAYHLTRTILPVMIKRRSGHIFNMCSIASIKAYHNGGAYGISKFALLGFNKNLREEMKPYNIKVTAILPGAAYTDSWKASGVDEKRFMTPGDVAAMVYACSLLSPGACVEEIVLRPQMGDL